jgi:predicted small secreted protein
LLEDIFLVRLYASCLVLPGFLIGVAIELIAVQCSNVYRKQRSYLGDEKRRTMVKEQKSRRAGEIVGSYVDMKIRAPNRR